MNMVKEQIIIYKIYQYLILITELEPNANKHLSLIK
jgi:hypothetical protein